MGPSGAGKSTLLKILACNIAGGVREGDLMVNGKKKKKKRFFFNLISSKTWVFCFFFVSFSLTLFLLLLLSLFLSLFLSLSLSTQHNYRQGDRPGRFQAQVLGRLAV
jgi:ABC-type polar amino acid transport system ATPase subunit